MLLYLLYRDGLLPADVNKLLAHAQLPPEDGEVIRNLGLLGARIIRPLKDTKNLPEPLFTRKPPSVNPQDDYSLSRFTPVMKSLLEQHAKGVLDQSIFPYTKPQLDANELVDQDHMSHASLRSAKPTWAKTRGTNTEARQRVIVCMAGGATYSESRACYEASRETNKDVYLLTSHMLTPSLFLRQVGDLSIDKRRLALPAEQPKPKAPAHLFETEAPPPQASFQPSQVVDPPTAGVANLGIVASTNIVRSTNGNTASHSATPPHPLRNGGDMYMQASKDEGKKKKHSFFSSKK